jgi:hypothetical protein
MTAQLIQPAATSGEAAELTRTSLKGVVPNITGLTGVTELLSAKHHDPVMNEGLHSHVWTVTAYWRSENFRDGRMLKGALRTLLDALPDADGILPPELWSGEAIAQRVLLLAECVGASVTRPEGFEAWVSQ